MPGSTGAQIMPASMPCMAQAAYSFKAEIGTGGARFELARERGVGGRHREVDAQRVAGGDGFKQVEIAEHRGWIW